MRTRFLTRLTFLVLLIGIFSASAQAQVCANPGKDGPGGTLSGVVNTYYPGTASVSAGSTSISIGSSTGSATPIASGDLLLVIQMQDAAINSSNFDSYGDGFSGSPASGSTAVNNSGVYEYVVATSAAGASVSIRGAGAGNGLVNSYTNAAASGSQGQRRFQVIRVPQYSSATLGSGLTALTWNGTTGGILVIDVAGNLALGSATVNLSGMGFRGGGVRQLSGGSGGTTADYVNLASNAFHASKGEGIAGTPRYIFNGTSVVDTGVEGYPNGSFARGAPGNAGGGGTDSEISTNQMNSGGGGGANWGAGGQGGRTWSANQDRGGHGGAGFTSASASRMIMGGGGGAGTRNNSSGTMSSGAAGGGIVMIRAGTFSGSGTITVNGADGIDADNDGGGGAGAGGSVLVVANSGGLGSLTINARGGVGGDAWITEPANGSPGARHGPGGGAGGGFIATNGSATTNVTGGTNGRTTTSLDAYGATAGSNGSVQSIFASDVPGADSGAQCVPVLTVTKTTSTPSVTNTASGTTATYSITVANAANRSSATNLNISDALPSGFTYSSTVSVTLNGGATRPSTTNPSVGATNPNWGVFTIPGGGSVVLTFNAAIASSVANGTYQNPATATYTDPTRTTASGTTTSNYNSGSSTAENVTVSSIDLTIAKSHTGNFQQGQTGATYSITVTNSGNIASSGTVTVTDTLPASLTATAISGTGWSCVLGTLTCTRSDALGAGASYPAITLTVNVASNAPSSVTNSATVSGGNEANTTNNTDTDPTTVTQMPDLTVNKSHSGNFTLGQTGATYSIVVTNSGSATTSGTVTMTDTLPTGLTATGISGGGWSCVLATLTCTRNSTRGPGNSFQTITVTVNVAANAPPTVTNTATVSGGGEINTSNNTDNDPTTIVQPDLTIAKSHTGNFTQGQTGAQYSLTVTNAGSASTNGTTVTVTDTLPTGLTATAITGTGWSCVLGTLTCTRTSVLTAGSSYPAITLTVDVANNAPASVTNLVTVSGGGQIYTGNDTATDPTTINQLPDLTVAKSHTGNFTQGQVGATYSITVTNSGFAATTAAVSVTDTLPASLTATDISGTGWSCVLGTLTCTRSDALANGASYPAITLTVNVSPTAPASVINSVAVSGGGQTNTSNDTATDPTTINPGVPNITLVKTVDPTGTQIPGTEIVYSVTYTNGGTAPAQNFIIIDPNPANVDPLERVFRNVDFKVGSMSSAPGTTGLVATFSYSNDGGTTWTYTPVSGGGGAPAGYDRNVTNVRWSFAGNLSQTSPNNTGGVGFTARIR
ncbi:MAG: beta strand repeat-containing protein [Pyrinomonadaceae bacterium]